MTCCPQAHCRSSLDSTIGVKMLNLKGFKSCNISYFSLHYLQTGNISVLTKWSSTRTFQLTQMILLSWNLVSKLYNPPNRKSFLNLQFIAEERVDLSKYPPACLPKMEEEFAVGTTSFVYGGWHLSQYKWKCYHLVVLFVLHEKPYEAAIQLKNYCFLIFNVSIPKVGERLIIRILQISFKRHRWKS